MRILFVCTGNSCRSPMAELYFAELCRRAGRSDFQAESAGTCTGNGGALSRGAAGVMRSLGIDGSGFRSRCFTPELAEEADLIVAMTASHRADILARAPGAAAKVRLLLDFDGGGDVPDPFGGGDARYRAVFARMKPALENLAQQLFR